MPVRYVHRAELQEKFNYGDLVWAKMPKAPYWPARIDCVELSRYPKKRQFDNARENNDEIWFVFSIEMI